MPLKFSSTFEIESSITITNAASFKVTDIYVVDTT